MNTKTVVAEQLGRMLIFAKRALVARRLFDGSADRPKADMRRTEIDLLRLPCRRAVACTVIEGAQEGAAFDNFVGTLSRRTANVS
jgi:hypothetical protein